MQRPTSVIMTIMAAASGSSTQPMRRAWSPKVNQVKLWTARKPGVCSVGKKATIARIKRNDLAEDREQRCDAALRIRKT